MPTSYGSYGKLLNICSFMVGEHIREGQRLLPKLREMLPSLCGSIVHYHPSYSGGCSYLVLIAHCRYIRLTRKLIAATTAQANFDMYTFYVPEWRAVVSRLSNMDIRLELPSFVEERHAFVTSMQAVSDFTSYPHKSIGSRGIQHARSVLEWKSGCYVQKWAEEDAAVEDRKAA